MRIYKISGSVRAYHGSPGEIDQFDVAFSGGGHAQEGPGIYFTSDYDDALGYTGPTGSVSEVRLNFSKTVPLSGPIPEDEIRKLILGSVGLSEEHELMDLDEETFYDSYLTDWGGEDAHSAYGLAVDGIMRYATTPHDAFQSVWYQHYRQAPVDYLKGMIGLGYDGVIIPKDGLYHYVVFNQNIITKI